MSIRYHREQILTALKLYNTNNNMSLTARQTGMSIGTIRRYILHPELIPQYSITEDNQIIDLLRSGYTYEQIKDITGHSIDLIRRLAKENNLMRGKGPASHVGDPTYFDQIDTEHKAYYLGWLMADGCVSLSRGYYLKIAIQYRDRIMIERFLESIQADYKIHKRIQKGKPYAYVSIGCKQIVTALIKYGVVPHKSGNEIVPDIVPHLIPHFFRGFFDGDGIVSDSQGKRSLRSGFIATENIIKAIQDIMGTNITYIHPKNTSEECHIYTFLWGKKDSLRFSNYIYRDATIWLERKREIFDRNSDNTEVTDNSNM